MFPTSLLPLHSLRRAASCRTWARFVGGILALRARPDRSLRSALGPPLLMEARILTMKQDVRVGPPRFVGFESAAARARESHRRRAEQLELGALDVA